MHKHMRFLSVANDCKAGSPPHPQPVYAWQLTWVPAGHRLGSPLPQQTHKARKEGSLAASLWPDLLPNQMIPPLAGDNPTDGACLQH